MSYELEFLPSALKEWHKLGSTVKIQFKKKLTERLQSPVVASDALHRLDNHYKIKLRSSGYRLVYRVDQEKITIIVVAIGKRERSAVYKAAINRLDL